MDKDVHNGSVKVINSSQPSVNRGMDKLLINSAKFYTPSKIVFT